MPPRIGDVVALPGLALTLHAGRAGTDRPVRWVAVSELADPTPFLEGGELVLTTGMRLAADPLPYVTRLREAGVAGLGLGLGLGYDDVPLALVHAADRLGLPLLSVPPGTAFIAVSKAVSDLLAAEERAEEAQGLAAQRELIRAALAGHGDGRAVVAGLARHLDGWALQLDRDGQVLAAAPSSARSRARALAPDVERLRPKGLLAAAVFDDGDDAVVLQPLGVRGRALGFLAVGTPGASTPAQRALVSLAVSLLSLDLARDQARSETERGVRALAVALALQGGADSLPMRDLGWDVRDGARVALAVVSAGDDADAAEAEAARRWPGAPVAVGALAADPSLLVALLPGDAAVDASPFPPGAALRRAGVGGPAASDDRQEMARSLAQARGALAAAGAGELRRHDELAGAGLSSLLDAQAADAWAAALLAPLDAPGERADLRGTLRAWLSEHGQVDAAAAELGIHRHTVRHRLRRAEALLGRPLDDPGVRAELWFALARDRG